MSLQTKLTPSADILMLAKAASRASSLLRLLVELVVLGEAMACLIEGGEPVIIGSTLHLHRHGKCTISAAMK